MCQIERTKQESLLTGPHSSETVPFLHHTPAAVEPTELERDAMASLAIGFEAGVFSFRGRRYGELADAVLDATLAWRRGLRR